MQVDRESLGVQYGRRKIFEESHRVSHTVPGLQLRLDMVVFQASAVCAGRVLDVLSPAQSGEALEETLPKIVHIGDEFW